MQRTLLAALLLAGVSAPAMAADLGMVMPAPSILPVVADAPTNWTGFSIGIYGGANFNPASPGVLQFDQDLDGDFSEPLIAPLLAAFGSNFSGSRESGLTAGASLGYDVQQGNFVFGGIVDIGLSNYSDSQSAFSSTPAFYTETRDLDFLATARVRAGFLPTENLLAYVHGGVAGGQVKYSYLSNTPATFSSSGGSNFSIGYQVGAGLEMMVSEGLSVGLEYGYTNLGESNFNTRLSSGPFVVANPTGTDSRGSDRVMDFHTLKATVKYRF